jgi:LacI family transcriptional regulator
VARQANVSVATASKVLNGRSGVGPATRDRVQQVMTDLGYRPTTARVTLPGLQTKRIAVAFSGFDQAMYSGQMLHSILANARDDQLQIMVSMEDPSEPLPDNRANAWARALLGGGCQGAVFITCELTRAQLDAINRIDLPVVAVDSYSLLTVGTVTVGAANFTGGMAVAQHLIELGHTRIGVISGEMRSTFAAERAHGSLAAMLDAALPNPQELMREGHFSYESGLDLGGELLDLPQPPTAIIANCDVCAWGVMQAARRRGLRVPEDLSVTGFDGTRLAGWSTPPLTTVVQPLPEIARMALRVITNMIDGHPPDSPRIQLATRLVVGGTTAPPAKR